MSKLNIKQIAGPVAGARAGTGAIPLFDGNLVRWSNAATTALQLPTGTTDQRPTGAEAVDGAFRYNSELGKIEARQAGSWINAISDVKSFLDLADAPKNYTSASGKVLAVNAAGTGIEYVDPTVTVDKIKGTSVADAGKYLAVKPDGSGLQFLPFPPVGNLKIYKFRVNFGSQYLTPTNTFTEGPDGWSAVSSAAPTATADKLTILTVTHNVGSPPVSGIAYGYNQPNDYWTGRPIGNASIELRWSPGTSTNQFIISGIYTNPVGAVNSTYAYVYVWFYL